MVEGGGEADFSRLLDGGFSRGPTGPQSLHGFSNTKHPPLTTDEENIVLLSCRLQMHRHDRKSCFVSACCGDTALFFSNLEELSEINDDYVGI